MYKVRLMLLLTMGMLLEVSWAQEPEKPGAQPFKVAFIGDNAGGDPNRAEAYFKTINGEAIDTFSMVKSEPVV